MKKSHTLIIAVKFYKGKIKQKYWCPNWKCHLSKSDTEVELGAITILTKVVKDWDCPAAEAAYNIVAPFNCTRKKKSMNWNDIKLEICNRDIIIKNQL
jgi:hypothetical protein